MSENKNLSHNRKKDFLSKEIEHIDITKFDARPIIPQWRKCLLYQEKLQMQLKYIMKC